MIKTGNIIEPEDGLVLTDGKTYSRKVYLSNLDSPDRWMEMTQEEAEALIEDNQREITDTDKAEGYDILMGAV